MHIFFVCFFFSGKTVMAHKKTMLCSRVYFFVTTSFKRRTKTEESNTFNNKLTLSLTPERHLLKASTYRLLKGLQFQDTPKSVARPGRGYFGLANEEALDV